MHTPLRGIDVGDKIVYLPSYGPADYFSSKISFHKKDRHGISHVLISGIVSYGLEESSSTRTLCHIAKMK